MVWTTTPWTLPANVAAAVDPEADYVAVAGGPGLAWVMEGRVEAVFGKSARVVKRAKGAELVGRPYVGPFDHLAAQEGVEHRIVAWDMVGADEGTGIVHIAPGCGEEDFNLGRDLGLPVLVPVDDSGAFYEPYGWLHGQHTADAASRSSRTSASAAGCCAPRS